MTNKELIASYANNPTLVANANNLSCREGVLYSYAEPIARYLGGHSTRYTLEPEFIVSRMKWSVTTTRHQNTLLGILAQKGRPHTITHERLTEEQ